MCRAIAVGSLAVLALAIPSNRSFYDLVSTGTVNLTASGEDVRYGAVPAAEPGQPIVTISLGATSATGSLTLSLVGETLPPNGRYPIRGWNEGTDGQTAFHALFVPGSVEQPLGAFHGESGWVTITRTASGRIAGEFQVQASGFLANDLSEEEHQVTVRGTFTGAGKAEASVADY